MNIKKTIKGKKVVLRPLSLNDAPRFCQWLSDTEVTKFLGAGYYQNGAPTVTEERAWITETKKKPDRLTLAIDTVAGEHIGSVSLFNINTRDKNAEFGILIGNKRYWGQGCGTEACRLIIAYGFKTLKLHKIYLRHIAYNFGGHRAYTKAGFKPEGVFRQQLFRDGHFHDEMRMAVLKKDFKL